MDQVENVDTNLKRALKSSVITTLVAIILNPVSIIIGFYIGRYLNSPDINPKNVSVNIEYADCIISKKVYNEIKNNKILNKIAIRGVSTSAKDDFKNNSFSLNSAVELRKIFNELMVPLFFGHFHEFLQK